MSRRRTAQRRAALSLAAVIAVASGVALAAPGGGGRAKLRVDAPAPLFDATNLLPGQRTSACARVTNAGDASGRAALYASGLHGALANHLTLTVTRRRTCDAAEAALVYAGALSGFPRVRDHAVVDGTTWAPGDAATYRFDLALGDDPAAEGLTASWAWRLAVETLPARTCTTLRGGELVLERRGVVVVVAPRRARVDVRLRGRARRARFRLNGRLVGAPATRPLTVRTGARSLVAGTNHLSVRAGGRVATFRLRTTARCALSSPERRPAGSARTSSRSRRGTSPRSRTGARRAPG